MHGDVYEFIKTILSYDEPILKTILYIYLFQVLIRSFYLMHITSKSSRFSRYRKIKRKHRKLKNEV